jgi:tetratricopeptide (TPR) repeat protein
MPRRLRVSQQKLPTSHPGKLTRWQLFSYTYPVTLFPPKHKRSSLRIFLPFHFASIAMLLFFAFILLPDLLAGQAKSASDSFDSLSKRAAEARDADRVDEAVALYKKALVLRPRWPEGWWSLGTLEYDRNNYPVAAKAFQRLLVLAPKDGTAHLMLGLCEFEMGQEDAALKHIQAAEKLGVAKNTQLFQVMLYHEGVLLLRKAKYENAQEVLQQLCRSGAENADILRALGLSVFRLSPKAAPPDTSPGAAVIQRTGHAECLVGGKKFDEARAQYKSLLAEYPEFPDIHYVYGHFLLEANDTEAALPEFEKQLELTPGHLNARLEIAAVKYRVDSAAGVPYAEQAVQLAPRLPFAHYLLGLLYADTGQYAKAIPELEIAQKTFSNEAQVYFALGNAYARTGRKEDAAKARSTFARLNQQKAGESTDNDHGQKPKDLDQGKLERENRQLDQ